MWKYQCFETKEQALEWGKKKRFTKSSLMDLQKEIKKDPYNCIPYLAGVDTNKYKYGYQWRSNDN